MFHVVVDIGDKRNIEIQVPDRVIGLLGCRKSAEPLEI